jgi:hypothetical protein
MTLGRLVPGRVTMVPSFPKLVRQASEARPRGLTQAPD